MSPDTVFLAASLQFWQSQRAVSGWEKLGSQTREANHM